MDLHSPSANRTHKRTAEETLSAPSSIQNSPLTTDTTPRILRRHHHRRLNIAASLWGPDTLAALPQARCQSTPSASMPRFNVYQSLLRHQNLFFQFALRLPYRSIIALYAIDKEFHYRLNKYSVSLIHDYARHHAPLAGHIFSWLLYPQLCISDPMLRPMDGREWLARDVPGFRWVGMILWRQKVVRSILTMLAVEGHRVPAGCEAALMKFWCLMEMRTAALRLSFLHDEDIWTAADIVLMQLFLVKLDMRFSDPVLGNGAAQLGAMLLSQKSLSTLWKVLGGRLKLDYDSATEMMVGTYLSEDLDVDTHPWLDDEMDNGVERGLLAREGWQRDGARMTHAVDMVVTEGIRRGLHVQQYYLDFVLYGFVHGETGRNLPLPTQLRRDKKLRLPSEGWPGKEVRDKTMRELDVRFGLV
ncbi:hypothetical protein TW65_01041 [Stemphylium lycopersici]|uniref:Uncharacterized protein n=1 Tax=Stemphylium lycopersici TaxID=183478 RepID=A0A364MX08_STELY|nr:hypothetical protein TW65_01041 [Stemphylium lycopersici]RAR05771.1 hypothetical protein DDE83_007231 [Stemphylium lycopersici]